MNNRFSLGNIDVNDFTNIRNTPKKTNKPSSTKYRAPVITALPRKKRFWERFYDYWFRSSKITNFHNPKDYGV